VFFLSLFFTSIRCTRLWTRSDSELLQTLNLRTVLQRKERKRFWEHNSTPPSCVFSHLHIIEEKYGERVRGRVENSGGEYPSFASRWWKDLMDLEREGGVSWFNREVKKRLENEMLTYFWKDKWLTNTTSFCESFPLLFSLTIKIWRWGKCGKIVQKEVSGDLSSIRFLFVWKNDLVQRINVAWRLERGWIGGSGIWKTVVFSQ